MKKKPEFTSRNITHSSKLLPDGSDPRSRELVEHLRQNRTQLRVNHAANGGRKGIQIIARDEVPEIRDLAQVMQSASEVGRGTTITMEKWRQ